VEPGVLFAETNPVLPQQRIKLDWTDSSTNETYFQLERHQNDVAPVLITIPANTITYVNIGLNPDTLYNYRVRAVNAAGASDWSNWAAASTYPLNPSQPDALSATTISKTRIDLHWFDSTGEDGFKIERKIGAGAYVQIATVGANVENFSNTGLAPGTLYTYRVRAFNAPGGVQNSAYSNQASATTIPNPPAAPNTLAAIGTNSTTVALTWVDASNNETGFRIERKVAAGAYSLIATRPANTTSYTDGSRTPNTTYNYRVRAYNLGGDSTYSNTAAVITLGAPSNLTATPVSPTRIDLAWTDNSPSDTGFKIERETAGVWTQIATVGTGVTTYVNNTGLTAGTAYKYRVRATRTGSDSTFSNVVSVSTPS
jgi:titin